MYADLFCLAHHLLSKSVAALTVGTGRRDGGEGGEKEVNCTEHLLLAGVSCVLLS